MFANTYHLTSVDFIDDGVHTVPDNRVYRHATKWAADVLHRVGKLSVNVDPHNADVTFTSGGWDYEMGEPYYFGIDRETGVVFIDCIDPNGYSDKFDVHYTFTPIKEQ